MSGAANPRRATRGLGGFEGFEVRPATDPAVDVDRPKSVDHGVGQGGDERRDTRAERPAPVPARQPEPAPRNPPAVSAPRRPASAGDAPSDAPARVPRRLRGRRQSLEERYGSETIRTSIVMPVAADDAIAQIAFEQRRKGVSKNDLFLEAIELLLKRYGAGSIGMLVEKDRAG